MDRAPNQLTTTPTEPPRPSAGLGPLGDVIQGQWPAQAADRIESVVGSVRRKTTGPAMLASRVLVYGIVIAVLAIIVAVLGLIAALRGLDALLPTWAVQLIVGGLLCLAGLFCWSRRRPKEQIS